MRQSFTPVRSISGTAIKITVTCLLVIAVICIDSFVSNKAVAFAIQAHSTRRLATTHTVDWPTFGYNVAHTHYNPHETILNPSNIAKLALDWKAPTGLFVQSSPVEANGIVYFGSEDEQLYAVDAQTGIRKWVGVTGGLIDATPAVANGVVYAASDDSFVYAYEANDGALLWKAHAGDAGTYSSPTVANGIVYVGYQLDSFNGALFAFNALTGALVWENDLMQPIYSVPAVVNTVVYIGALQATFAFDAQTGKQIWSVANGGNSPAVVNGIVYIGTVVNGRSTILNAYAAKTGAAIWSSALTAIEITSPAVANGIIYVGADSQLCAFSASTGKELWTASTGDDISSTPSVANGVAYVGSFDHNLYAFNAKTGKFLARVYTLDSIEASSPAVVNGIVYIGSDDHNLYAFHVPGTN